MSDLSDALEQYGGDLDTILAEFGPDYPEAQRQALLNWAGKLVAYAGMEARIDEIDTFAKVVVDERLMTLDQIQAYFYGRIVEIGQALLKDGLW